MCEYLNLLEKDYFALSFKELVSVDNKSQQVRVSNRVFEYTCLI